jgi:hypothetical protein
VPRDTLREMTTSDGCLISALIHVRDSTTGPDELSPAPFLSLDQPRKIALRRHPIMPYRCSTRNGLHERLATLRDGH